jgi:hypothetical protein
MKVTNADAPGVKATRATRGMVSTNVAGSKGMIWRDATTESVGQIRDMTLGTGLNFYDNEDGTGILTTGGPAGGPGFASVTDPNFGATGNGVTDDTEAIQAAVDWVVAAGGGIIYFPPGVYIIDGPLLDTAAFNAQLLLPNVAHTGVDHLVITFQGPLRPGFHPLFGDTVPLAAGYAVLKSTLTGATGTGAVISGGNNVSPPGSGGGNNLEVNVENLICLGPDNPTFTFWNLRACQGGQINGLQISTPGAYVGTPTLPTNTNSYGIRLPEALFSNNTKVSGLAAGGFYTGVLSGELAVYEGPLILGPTYYGIEIPATYYPALIHQLTATSVIRVINVTGAPTSLTSHRFDILQYVRESSDGSSFETEYDLYDASNYGAGYIRYFTYTTAGGGGVDTFLQSGGTGMLVEAQGNTWGGGSAASSGGEILISDTPSTPLVFADLVQNEAQNDLVYGD